MAGTHERSRASADDIATSAPTARQDVTSPACPSLVELAVALMAVAPDLRTIVSVSSAGDEIVGRTPHHDD
jgi:hypothetical protein